MEPNQRQARRIGWPTGGWEKGSERVADYVARFGENREPAWDAGFLGGLIHSHRIMRGASCPVLGAVVGVETTENVVALTFDDGPHPEYTARFLEILARHRAKATFFMVGERANQYPDLVDRVAQGNHAIGNHTWDHPSFPRIHRTQRRSQLEACDAALAPFGRRIFRPPYGHLNLISRLQAFLLGYEVVGWSGHVGDWIEQEADDLVTRILRAIEPGGIVVLHDSVYDPIVDRDANREPLLAALDWALAELEGEYEFVTVPELFRRGRRRRAHWHNAGDSRWLTTRRAGVGGGDHFGAERYE
jgi:peptidoglycan-N-acetylglucosamine deacetylase